MTKLNTTTNHLAVRIKARNPKTVPFFGHFKTTYPEIGEVNLAFTADVYAYVGSPLCLHLWSQKSEEGGAYFEPFTDLTKNIRPNECENGEIIVKAYEENEPLRKPLLDLGYFEDTGKRIPGGFVEFEIWRVTQKFEEAFSTVHPSLEEAMKKRN